MEEVIRILVSRDSSLNTQFEDANYTSSSGRGTVFQITKLSIVIIACNIRTTDMQCYFLFFKFIYGLLDIVVNFILKNGTHFNLAPN